MCALIISKKKKKKIELWQWHCRKCEEKRKKKKKRNRIVAKVLPKQGEKKFHLFQQCHCHNSISFFFLFFFLRNDKCTQFLQYFYNIFTTNHRWLVIVGAKIWAFALDLKFHSLIITRPRRRKYWKRPHSR